MSRLGHVRTDVGLITLHVKHGVFTTTNAWTGTDGKTHRTTIVHTPQAAFDWYRLCQDRGHVRRDFPLDGER